MVHWKLPFRERKRSEGLVFIVGCPRSGTSWTWGLLSSLSQVEPLLIEDFHSLSAHDGIRQMKTEEGYVTTETTVFHHVLPDMEIRRCVRRKMKKYPGSVLLEKTPANALKMERITALFPAAKIVHVYRDPRAVVNSMLQSVFSGGYRIVRSLQEAIIMYRQYFEAMKPFRYHQNVVQLQYEALFRNPAAELGRVCSFIGIDTGLGALVKTTKVNKGKAQTVSSNDFRKGEINSYLSELEPGAIAEIERELADVFNVYGYNPAFTRSPAR